MTTHLNEEEFTAAVEGLELSPEATEHLAACISCRQQVDALQRAAAERLDEMEGQMPDWDHQRDEILACLPSSPAGSPAAPRRWLRPLMALAAVFLMAVGLSSLWEPPEVPEPVAGAEIEIDVILAEVDAVLADDSLPGFEFIDPGVDDPESLIENSAS